MCGFKNYNLKEHTIPEGVKKVGYAAFQDCAELSTITIPKSVTTIGSSAFMGCPLTSVVVEITTPITIDNTVFNNYYISQNTTLFVPEGCKTAYSDANCWKVFKSIVELVLPKANELTYNGAAQDLITASSFETMKYSLTGNNYDWDSTIPQGKDAKEYTVYYKDTGYSLTGSVIVTIAPKEVTNPTILCNDAYVNDDYDHSPIEAPLGVLVKDGDKIIPTEEYTVSYSNNTNVGIATVTITDKTIQSMVQLHLQLGVLLALVSHIIGETMWQKKI